MLVNFVAIYLMTVITAFALIHATVADARLRKRFFILALLIPVAGVVAILRAPMLYLRYRKGARLSGAIIETRQAIEDERIKRFGTSCDFLRAGAFEFVLFEGFRPIGEMVFGSLLKSQVSNL